MNTCRLCNGPLYLLGQLGRLLWLRCRNCGMEYSRNTRKPRARKPRARKPVTKGQTV